MFLVALDFRIFQLATNQTFSVKDSVFRVGVEGILSGVTDTSKVNPQSEMKLESLMNKRLTVVPRRRKKPMKG